MKKPQSQDELLQQLETAIGQRDLHVIKSLSPQINWMYQYRRDAVATEKDFGAYRKQALLSLFIAEPDEQISVKNGWRRGGPAWKDFCQEALSAMISNGYRVLDDTYYLGLMTEQFDFCPSLLSFVINMDCEARAVSIHCT
jgi:hypothetical protein